MLPQPGTSLFLVPRVVLRRLVVAVDGGPSLVSCYFGSYWAADRPTTGRFLALLR
ncbi:UNVERIFIED_ORG: hypothetical protein ABIB52_003882 [Arthrobacter sp. UYCu721]